MARVSSVSASEQGTFSSEHLHEALYRRCEHLRFCRWCRCGMEPKQWLAHAVEGTEFVRCPQCNTVDRLRTLKEVDAFHQPITSPEDFVCYECGKPYQNGVRPPAPMVDIHPENEEAARNERLRRYSEPWTVFCHHCGKSTQPIRTKELEELRTRREHQGSNGNKDGPEN